MLKSSFIAIVIVGSFQCSVACAQNVMELKGQSAGCENNQKMGLWDISSGSPLIRNDMLRSGYCFAPTLDGLKVYVVENIGKFARVRNLSNGVEYLVYRSDLRNVREVKEVPVAKNAEGLNPRLKSVTNLVGGEVYEIDGKPTAQINLAVNQRFSLYFSIPKFAINESFNEKITNQKNPKLQVGGRCSGTPVGVGSPDWYQLRFVELDDSKKIAKIEVSGTISKCSIDNPSSYSFANSPITISGKNYTELVRPHTAKEMTRVFKPFKW